ncbi:MAG TPA: hypothetical protein VJT67_07530, partial [Longimicrobiaceae bacterium]|nr:hypothetical protein [Longimicrobiaceae bacterium]
MFALAALAACAPSEAEPVRVAEGPAPPYAVLTERGTRELFMQPGPNVRVMQDFKVRGPEHIGYDPATGVVTLTRGVFRISGYSITTFGYKLSQAQRDSMHSEPGYAYLCNIDSRGMQTLGSMQDPILSLPSHVDDVIAVPGTTRFYLGHQNGDTIQGVHLETYWEGLGTNHVFARLVVERLGD